MSAGLLEVERLRTRFVRADRSYLRAVDGVSLQLRERATMGVVGESGSGKSVLARSIMGLLPPTASMADDSVVQFDGLDVRNLPKDRAKHFWGVDVALVSQDALAALNPTVRVGRQIAEPLQFHKHLDKRAARARAVELLRLVGVPEPEVRLRQFPHQLSGGMRQRVVIAIALACEPRLLVADEPTTALDVTVQRQILDLISRLQRELGMALLLITHDLGVVAARTDEVAVMYAGRIVEHAATRQLFQAMRHPYTEALLDSIPRLADASHTKLRSISGRPPQIIGTRTGCAFAARCRYAQDRCLVEDPPEARERSTGHRWSCFYPVGTSAGEQALAVNIARGRTASGTPIDH